MDIVDKIEIRNARTEDISEVVAVEEEVWQGLGTDILGREHFEAWLEVNPIGFWVAVFEGKVVGYTYSFMQNWTFGDMSCFRSSSCDTDDGFTRKTHDPKGNSIYGYSIGSTMRGAGRKLVNATLTLAKETNKEYYFGFSRISKFSEFMDNLEKSGRLGPISAEKECELALWYAIECARIDKSIVWEDLVQKPKLDLPPLAESDPILRKHIKYPGMGVGGIIPGYMQDPKSRDYMVMTLWRRDK